MNNTDNLDHTVQLLDSDQVLKFQQELNIRESSYIGDLSHPAANTPTHQINMANYKTITCTFHNDGALQAQCHNTDNLPVHIKGIAQWRLEGTVVRAHDITFPEPSPQPANLNPLNLSIMHGTIYFINIVNCGPGPAQPYLNTITISV